MKHLFAPFALLIATLTVGCASDAPLYPGTVAGNSRGVIAPGQTIVTQAQPPSPFGTPSNVPDTIRGPVIAQPAFATPVDMDAIYGYDSQGRQGMAEGDPNRAEFNFERALEVNPFDAVALNNLAVAKAEGGQFYEAMSLLERAAKLTPDNSEVIANLARLRGYVQSYATAGVEPSPTARTVSGNLPVAPPALWGSVRYESSYEPVYERSMAPRPSAAVQGDYYVSDACRRVSAKNGKVDVVCEPAR